MMSRTAKIIENALNMVPLDARNNDGPINDIESSQKTYHNLEPLQPPVGVDNITSK